MYLVGRTYVKNENAIKMKISNFLPLVDFTGGVVATVISIVVCFAIIGALLFYVKRKRKSKKGMVHNRPKKNDHPESLN